MYSYHWVLNMFNEKNGGTHWKAMLVLCGSLYENLDKLHKQNFENKIQCSNIILCNNTIQ